MQRFLNWRKMRMKIERDNYTFLTQGPIHRVIGTMAVPTIISMLVISLYNVADTFFVGKIDTQSTAAVGIVFSVMFFIQAFSFFFGNGSGNYISRELGAKRHRNAEVMAATAFFYALLTGIVILIVGEALLSPLSVVLGSTPTILPYTEKYMGIVLFGAPFVTSSLTLNNQMRFQGNANYAMRGIVAGAILNVVLDPVFIFGFGMGVSGAALATVIGQISSFLILLRMTHRGGSIRIRWCNFSWSPIYLREIIAGGTPSLLRQGLTSLATVMLNVGAGVYGDAAIAAMSIVSRFTMMVMATVIGFGQGFQPFCGFCYGAQLYARVREGFWFSVKFSTIFLAACSVLSWIFSDGIIDLFRRDSDVIDIGCDALRWQLSTLPLCGLIMLGNMLLQTIRKPWRANLLAAARSGLFFIPFVIIFPRFFGLAGVEMSQPMSDICATILTLPIVLSVFREMTNEERKKKTPLTDCEQGRDK